MKTQTQKIIAALKRGGWWSKTALFRASGSLHIQGRVYDARRLGYVIENRIKRNGRRQLSQYKLV